MSAHPLSLDIILVEADGDEFVDQIGYFDHVEAHAEDSWPSVGGPVPLPKYSKIGE